MMKISLKLLSNLRAYIISHSGFNSKAKFAKPSTKRNRNKTKQSYLAQSSISSKH